MTTNNFPNCFVLMATFNGEKYLEKQLNSILSQQNVNVFIFYRDDGSLDNTKNILQKFDQVLEIQDEFPKGCGSAANFLSLISSVASKRSFLPDADFIFLADQDDIWFPSKMSEAIKFLHSSYQCYSSSILRTNKNCDPASARYINKKFFDLPHTSFCRSPGPGFTFAFRADAFYELASSKYLTKFFPYTKNFVRWHDWLLFTASIELGLNWYIDKDAHAYYRIHATNDTGSLTSIYSLMKRIKFLVGGSFFMEMIKVNRYRSDINFKSSEKSFFRFISLLSLVEFGLMYKFGIMISYIFFRIKRLLS